MTPAIRRARGAISHAPSQDTARNTIATAIAATTAGHARSIRRARPAACDRPVSLPARSVLMGLTGFVSSSFATLVPIVQRKDATLTLTKAEVCRGRSYPRNSAADG